MTDYEMVLRSPRASSRCHRHRRQRDRRAVDLRRTSRPSRPTGSGASQRRARPGDADRYGVAELRRPCTGPAGVIAPWGHSRPYQSSAQAGSDRGFGGPRWPGGRDRRIRTRLAKARWPPTPDRYSSAPGRATLVPSTCRPVGERRRRCHRFVPPGPRIPLWCSTPRAQRDFPRESWFLIGRLDPG